MYFAFHLPHPLVLYANCLNDLKIELGDVLLKSQEAGIESSFDVPDKQIDFFNLDGQVLSNQKEGASTDYINTEEPIKKSSPSESEVSSQISCTKYKLMIPTRKNSNESEMLLPHNFSAAYSPQKVISKSTGKETWSFCFA